MITCRVLSALWLVLFGRTTQHLCPKLIGDFGVEAFGDQNGIALDLDDHRAFLGIPGVISAARPQRIQVGG